MIHQNLAGDAGAVSKGQNNRRRDGGEFGRCGSDQTSDRSAVLIPLVSLITPAARSHLEKSSPQSGLRNVRSDLFDSESLRRVRLQVWLRENGTGFLLERSSLPAGLFIFPPDGRWSSAAS